ncbi:DUF4913 domain-containing protein [Embleya hyalina]|uniref:DUF4913 domain-containing protein n=1 Tax=Embleya hyalina TaxID=516124 RepID=A0A401YQM5_9ACTN|nr:DUF4913 domain-containing protein [Embleya hyalina]GCD96918.1 DUF4913 domain-containing protein [Embleya hyalina]
MRESEEPIFFTSLEEFVTVFFAPLIRRRLNRAVALWCPEWWAHPEAVSRLSSMWRSFEYLRNDVSLGMSVWWTQHADPHLRLMMDPDYGPFALCDPRDGHNSTPLPPLPLVAVPEGLLDHAAFRVDTSIYQQQKMAEKEGTQRSDTDGLNKNSELNPGMGF